MLTPLFTTPEMLLALAALPVLGVIVWLAGRSSRRMLARLGHPAMMQMQVVRFERRWLRGFGWCAGLVLLIVAAAGPRWGFGPPPATMPGRDVILVVDLSRSMLARDALPNRLGRGQEALTDLIDAVQSRGGHRLALVAFAGRAKVICSLTNDYDHVRSKLNALTADPLPPELQSLGVSGTRIGAGLVTAVSLLDPASRGAQDIVLVSDGDDPVGDNEWREGYRAAKSAGIPIHVVGIGDPQRDSPVAVNGRPVTLDGAPAVSHLHEAPLRETTTRTGGKYVSSGTAKPDLAALLRDTINPGPTRESIEGTLPQPVPRHEWFLLAGLAIFALLLVPRIRNAHLIRRSRAVATACFALLLNGAASAPNTEIRRGVALIEAGRNEESLTHFALAAERTTDPGLVAFNEGVALFRLGRFRESEIRFRSALSDAEGLRRAQANYNLGCALVQSSRGLRIGPLKEAIAAFEQALASPDLSVELHKQATENLELARRLLAQAPPEKQPTVDQPEHGDEKPAVLPGGNEMTEPGRSTAAASERARNGKQSASENKQGGKAPGKGSLPPLPDEDALAKLTPDDARAHLDRAVERIIAARKQQLQRRAPTPSTQFPDW